MVPSLKKKLRRHSSTRKFLVKRAPRITPPLAETRSFYCLWRTYLPRAHASFMTVQPISVIMLCAPRMRLSIAVITSANIRLTWIGRFDIACDRCSRRARAPQERCNPSQIHSLHRTAMCPSTATVLFFAQPRGILTGSLPARRTAR